MTTAAAAAPLVVRTVPVPDPGPLPALLPAQGAVAWLRGGDGLVGWGEAARLDLAATAGTPVRGGVAAAVDASSARTDFPAAARWWSRLCAGLAVHDEVETRGSGPVAFGSFGFSTVSTSTLVLPRVVLGRRDGRAWLTTVDAPPPRLVPQRLRRPGHVRYHRGAQGVAEWRDAVATAVARIRRGELDKVVLAFDLLASCEDVPPVGVGVGVGVVPPIGVGDVPAPSCPTDLDLRWLLDGLAARNPDCWTFTVDGLVGSTPELLLERDGTSVHSRVLAGTVPRGPGGAAQASLLTASAKDLAEHRPAVSSVADRLAPHCADLDVPAAPRVLQLATVAHLETDVRGRLRDDVAVPSALALAGDLHPTAAVAGTPTAAALEAIRLLEGRDRGRYAGPVGWVDAAGDGEWAIALRCAAVEGRQLRLWAGCGIVADSDPDAEVAEWEAKIAAMREVLDG